MSSILKQMASLYGRLKWAYSQGMIAYPRVANDYISHQDMKFYEYPHKPLTTFDEHSVPLQSDLYAFSKISLPLHLTHKNISTPATIVNNLAYVDMFLDDDLRPRNNALGLEEKLDEVMEMLRESAQELYMQEVSDGTREYTSDPLVMDDSELLAVVAKDGDVTSGFAMEIMPYSIELSPYNQECEEEEEREREERDKDQKVTPLSNPQAFKAFCSPSRNFEDEVVQNPIPIQNINEFIMLENMRLRHEKEKERLETIEQEHDNKMIAEENNIRVLDV